MRGPKMRYQPWLMGSCPRNPYNRSEPLDRRPPVGLKNRYHPGLSPILALALTVPA
jgi:hypothetical protein